MAASSSRGFQETEVELKHVRAQLMGNSKVIRLLSEGKLTSEDINKWSKDYIDYLLNRESILQRVLDGDIDVQVLKKEKYINFSQKKIHTKLVHFMKVCNEDITWYVGKDGVKVFHDESLPAPADYKKIVSKRFSKEHIKTLNDIPGFCGGLTHLWLASAYQEELERKAKDSKVISENVIISDNLKRFYESMRLISEWDEDPASLTAQEKKTVRQFIYQLVALQTSQHDLQKSLFFSNDLCEESSFIQESIYILTVTKAQLKEKLSRVLRKDRLVSISANYHATGIFNGKYYDPNSACGDLDYENWDKLVELIFRKTLCGRHPGDDTCAILTITQSRHRNLSLAAHPSVSEIVEDSAKAGIVDPLYKMTPIHVCVYRNSVSNLKVYLSKSTSELNAIDLQGYTALQLAAIYGYEDILRELIKHENCEMNIVDKYGNTALSNAIIRGHAACAALLIQQKGCDINLNNDRDETPLINAAYEGMEDIVTALLAKDACQINSVCRDGNSALFYAISRGYSECAYHLLEHKDIDINIANNVGSTALMQAALVGDTKMLVKLLEFKECNFDAYDKFGNTALALAIKNGHLECARILIRHGVTCNFEKMDWGIFTTQKNLNLASEGVQRYIEKGLITPIEACMLTAAEKDRIEQTTHRVMLESRIVSIPQILEATDEQLTILQIIFKTLSILPESKDYKYDLRSKDIDVCSWLNGLKIQLDSACTEQKWDPENISDMWLVRVLAILNRPIDKSTLFDITDELKAAWKPIQIGCSQKLIEAMYSLLKETLPTSKPFISFKRILKSELKELFESKALGPREKLVRIEKKLWKIVSEERCPPIYHQILAALPCAPLSIFHLQKTLLPAETKPMRRAA